MCNMCNIATCVLHMCTSHVHFTALHCDMCHMCNMCNMCYMYNMCNASLHCTLFYCSALRFIALHCIAACVLHRALCYTVVHCGTALLCCCAAVGLSWGLVVHSGAVMAPGVFVTPGCPTHRHRICRQQPYSLPTTLIALNLSLKVMVWFLSLLPSYALADPVLKIWVTFLATGLKRGADISKS